MEYMYKKWFKNQEKAAHEHAVIMQDETTVVLPFEISPMNYEGSFQLYYRPSNEMMVHLAQVYQQDALLMQLDGQLPGIAKDHFLRGMVVDEIFDSNALENVQSTRAEIAESVRLRQQGVPTKRRLSSMVYSYYGLAEDRLRLPATAADVRTIYDHVTEGEIAEEDLPDGQLFRDGPVSVLSGVAGKRIHEGLVPETRISAAIEALLAFMDGSTLPDLIKIAVAHYYFGYVHPFYDGNGRTGRFISSLYLSKICSKYTAYSLSQGCRLAQRQYGELFKRSNDFRNYGEMNCFIEGFLQILVAGQVQIIENLQERRALLDQAALRIQNDAWLVQDETKKNLMLIFEQGRLFDDYEEGFTQTMLQHYLPNDPKLRLRRSLDELEAAGYIRRIKQRPITYVSMWV